MQDLHSNIHPTGVAVTANADNTATVSGIIDRQGYNSLEFLIATGTLADVNATFTVLVQDGAAANLSDAANVSDADLLGTEVLAGFAFGDDDEARKIGYKGSKRYVQCTVTPADNTSAAPIAIIPLLGHPGSAPTANPPE